MTELQEPITTIEPILGLGEDYEPEIYALPIYYRSLAPAPLMTLCDQPQTVVFRAEADCPKGFTRIQWGTPDEFAAPGVPVSLADASLNILRTWPV